MNIIKRILSSILCFISFFILFFMEYPYYNKEDVKFMLNNAANQKSKLDSYFSLLMILLKMITGLFMFFCILIFGLLVIALLIGGIIQCPSILISILIIGSLPYVLMLYLRKTKGTSST